MTLARTAGRAARAVTRRRAGAVAVAVTEAELIRRGVTMVLEASPRPERGSALPVFDSGKPMSAGAMDDSVYQHIKERAARR